MRAVIQRVSQASVSVGDDPVAEIGTGLLVLVGVAHDDGRAVAGWLAEKLVTLRVFDDESGKMNLSVLDVGGAVLAVSQFTLLGDARKGRRPSFVAAARGPQAEETYEAVVEGVRARGVRCETGVFGARMKVALVNDGPVTILLDSGRAF